MPKRKTKSGAKKRFKKTYNGSIKRKHAFKNHLLTKKSKKRKRNLSKFNVISKSDMKNIKKQI
ncbi:50S ribosomal protein L35 [Blattabacterium cuenoti]|uniref:50S ribosomal protein L35 n=1 Tax=Blattabacterium cuenoti TaxID=1653831 RepID=UPI00163CC6FE|nr:50S ribosomal protein L35 [Blattabacterium cuenoti]